MDLRSATNIANFAFDKNVGAQSLQFLDGSLGLADIFIEGQRRKVKHDPIESSLCGLQRAGQGMCVIGIQENGETVFVPQAPDQREKLRIAHELPFPFGCSDDDGNVSSLRCLENGL
jgi:hypothetical protein